jgi:hypothetical protein
VPSLDTVAIGEHQAACFFPLGSEASREDYEPPA